MAAFLYGSRPDHFVLRCYVYSHHLCMCNRSCNCDHSHSLEPDRQAGDPLLIQIGGIGLIALASIIFISLNKKISLKNRRMIQESYNLEQMSGLVTVVRKVVLCVFAAEGIGAVGYAFCFVPEFGLVKGLGQAVFTAVSAFCNAGIDLLGENSLADYVTNPLVNVTTMGLIIASGLGFNVWWDLGERIKLVFQKKLSPGRLFRTFVCRASWF